MSNKPADKNPLDGSFYVEVQSASSPQFLTLPGFAPEAALPDGRDSADGVLGSTLFRTVQPWSTEGCSSRLRIPGRSGWDRVDRQIHECRTRSSCDNLTPAPSGNYQGCQRRELRYDTAHALQNRALCVLTGLRYDTAHALQNRALCVLTGGQYRLFQLCYTIQDSTLASHVHAGFHGSSRLS